MSKNIVDMGQHFSTGMLIRYTLPSMAMLVFASIYCIVDGLFISNFTGKTAFAAVNFIMPFVNIINAFGFMMGTGGAALVAKILGEGDVPRANRAFSLIIYATLGIGIVIAITAWLLMPWVAETLGATGKMLDISILYGRLCMISAPAFALQLAFQSYFPAAGKPRMGLWVTIAAGVTNIILDALFVGLLGWGVTGAAVATIVSEYLGGGIPFIYFLRPNTSLLRLGATRMHGPTLSRTCLNGCSELMGEIAFSIVSMVYNVQLLHYLGQDGVAAYGIIMYTGFIFAAIMFGFTVGASPLMSYQYGAQNRLEIQSLFRKSLGFMVTAGLVMLVAAETLAGPITWIFANYDADLYQLTVRAYRIYAISFALMGFPIYGSSLFTALNNGPVSAAISFLRTLVFEVASVILLPLLFGPNAIWLSVSVAEFAALIVTMTFILKLNKRYGYLPSRKNA